MATPKQIAANRANAKVSTGPSTAQGKLRSSKNATLHGILSRELLVGNEDPTEYEHLLTGLVDDFTPQGVNEQMLVEKMAIALWKMKRLNAAEAATIKHAQMMTNANHASISGGSKPGLNMSLTIDAMPANSDRFIRYQAQLEGQYYRAMAMLQAWQGRRSNNVILSTPANDIQTG
jgi:hypothetical protein